MTTNIQVVEFSDTDTYQEVVKKAAKGLGIMSWKAQPLICSGGVVPETEICGQKWSLGEYIRYNGGTSNRSKKVWGILVEDDKDKDPFSIFETVSELK